MCAARGFGCLRSLVFRPSLYLVCALVLAGAATFVPWDWGKGSIIGELVVAWSPWSRARPTGGHHRIRATIVRERDGFRAFNMEDQSWDRSQSLLEQHPERVFFAETDPTERPVEALWIPWRFETARTVEIFALSSTPAAPSRADRAAIRAEYLHWLGSDSGGARPDLVTPLASGDTINTRYVVLNAAMNVASILALTVLVAGAVGWCVTVRERRRRRLLVRAICPACGYDLSGLTRGHDRVACPECGRAWTVLPTPPGDASSSDPPPVPPSSR